MCWKMRVVMIIDMMFLTILQRINSLYHEKRYKFFTTLLATI